MKTKRLESASGDLVQSATASLPHIRMAYGRFEGKRPVMVLDIQSHRIDAYPYEQFMADLSERSQIMLAADYAEAVAKNKIVVFVRDNKTRRLVSMLFDCA